HRGTPPRPEPASDGVEVIRLSSRLAGLSVLLTQQFGRPVLHRRTMRNLMRDGNFDVINFHNISLAGGPGVLAVGQAVKLYMAHEHWLVCPSHVLWRHQREACTGRECLRCVLRYRRPPQLWRYTGYLSRQLRHVDRFIAMSEFSRRKHLEFGFPRDMEVVNYFLPDEQPAAVAPGEKAVNGRPYFLYVGRLEKIKGLDDVIPIFSRYPDADLLIAGDGEHADRLKAVARGISNVRFLGRLAPEDLNRYYRQSVALIVPTVGFETFGIILIEAFRQATPVLARRIGPFPEIVDRCGGGLLFGDAGELMQAMTRMQRDRALRDRLARAARRGFEDYWTESAVIPRYLDVVRQAAQARRRPDIVETLDTEGQT
ncbi:MAG TPA: glycosyltransferase family 4 protein, partial [Candidatus Polarisedimenticolia bacterium]|nr:glycosyltransferase family 4 protein [Candidatus Polarisedimenticolia bacterium]